MAVAEAQNGAARWSRFVPLCAVFALLVGVDACLNPIPDDFPNQHDDSAPIDGPIDPVVERPGEDDSNIDDADGEETAPQSPPAPSQGASDPDTVGAGDAGAARAAAHRSDAGHEALDAGVPTGAEP